MIPKARAVILAAGESKRMQGAQKLLVPFRGKPMIEYALEAAAAWEPLVIASPEVANYLAGRKHIALLVNEHPEKGMSHSLQIADRALPAEAALLVLLGDKPLASVELIRTVCDSSQDADVAYPQRGDEPGHPVYFSAKARTRIGALPAGDSIRLLRDDPELKHRALEIDDPGAYFDVDSPGALEGARE